MTLEEFKKIYYKSVRIESVTFDEFTTLLKVYGVKIDEPEEKIEITRSQLEKIVGKYVCPKCLEPMPIDWRIHPELLKELGFSRKGK